MRVTHGAKLKNHRIDTHKITALLTGGMIPQPYGVCAGDARPKVVNVALTAALGFAVSAPVYAVDTSQTSQTNRSTTWSDAGVRTAMDKCNNLTGTAQAKCIVNNS
jgi:hypothetical protein